VILTRTPCDTSDPGHDDAWCRTLTQHGDACVAQDCRWRFASSRSDTVFR